MDNFSPWLEHYDPGVPTKIRYPDHALPVLLENAAKKEPEKICVIYQRRRFSFSKIDNEVTDLARNLILLGIKKGDRIGLILDNSPGFLIGFFGILKAGGVVVAINPRFKESEIGFEIDEADIKGVIGDQGFVDKNPKIISNKKIRFFIIFEINPDLEKVNIYHRLNEDTELQKLGEIENAEFGIHAEFPKLIGGDTAIYQFSGGTTGIPKAAIGLHRNLVANVLQFSYWLAGLKMKENVFLGVIPYYHVYGMVLGLCLPIYMTSTQVLIANFQDIDQLIKCIVEERPTIFPAVPNMFSSILSSPRVIELRDCSLEICISGSAPLEIPVKDRFEGLTGAKILEGYGLSEAPTATHCNPLLGINKNGSIGMPLPDVHCRLVDLEQGVSDVSPGKQGELILKSPQVMQGYANNPEETKLALREDWLYTGDIARMDEDGYFYITGRKKDLIKVSGFQVWPREIEEVIRRFPGIKDVVVAGVKDEKTGERAKAWLLIEEGSSIDFDRLKNHCGKFLTDYKIPREFEIIDEFPRSSIGKVLRRELVRLDELKKSPVN